MLQNLNIIYNIFLLYVTYSYINNNESIYSF